MPNSAKANHAKSQPKRKAGGKKGKQQKQVIVRVTTKQDQMAKTAKRKTRLSVRNAMATSRVGDGVKNIMHFLNPAGAYNFRWPFEGASTTPSATRTGAVVLHQVRQYANSAGFAGTYCGANAAAKGIQVFYLFRNPLRAAVILDTVSAPATYSLYQPSGSTTYAPLLGAPATDLAFAYATADDPTNAPHSQYLFMGGLSTRTEMSFVWLGKGDKITITTSGTGTPDDWFAFWKVDSPGSTSAQAAPVAAPYHLGALSGSPITILTALEAGYYGVSNWSKSTDPITWAYEFDLVVAAGDCFSHIPVPNAMLHASYMSSVRLLSSSLLISNVASNLNVEGSIYGAVISDGTPFYNHTTPGDLSAKTDSFCGRAAKGLYTWLRPGGDNTFQFRHAMNVDPTTGSVTDTTFALDDGSSYQVAAVFVTGTTGTTFPALDFLTALTFCLEFKSDDQWVELEYPSLTGGAATSSLEIAMRAHSFAENPLHLSDIRAFAQKAGRFLRAHSQRIGGALSILFPEYATPINTMGKLFQS